MNHRVSISLHLALWIWYYSIFNYQYSIIKKQLFNIWPLLTFKFQITSRFRINWATALKTQSASCKKKSVWCNHFNFLLAALFDSAWKSCSGQLLSGLITPSILFLMSQMQAHGRKQTSLERLSLQQMHFSAELPITMILCFFLAALVLTWGFGWTIFMQLPLSGSDMLSEPSSVSMPSASCLKDLGGRERLLLPQDEMKFQTLSSCMYLPSTR